jgi:calcineurin-like phosphoesterase family protein
MKLPALQGVDYSKIYFMGDLHFQHKRVLECDSRGYSDIAQMEDYICETLKETLTEDCILFDLGDMFFGTRDNKFKRLMNSIPCPIYKVLGNHDDEKYFREKHSDKFKAIADFYILHIDNYPITIAHYPIIDYPYMYHGGLEVFGHTHGHLDDFIDSIPYLMVDIGFHSRYSRKRGTFLHNFQDILDGFKMKTGGMDFKEWAQQEYHGRSSLWSPVKDGEK